MTTNPQQAEGRLRSPRRQADDRRPDSLVREATRRTIPRLQAGYRQDVPAAVAAVARLRREAGRDAYASPTGWGLDDLETLTEIREERRQEEEEHREGQAPPRRYFSPYAREWEERRQEREDKAVHLAVTLWALHQQSLRDEPMHVPGWPLGRAVRRLAQGKTGTQDLDQAQENGAGPAGDGTEREPEPEPVEEVSQTIRKRFVRIGTSTDVDVLGTRLREMVLLLRASRIPLDYERLADQICRWQDEEHQDDVRRGWGREFHLTYRKSKAAGGDGGDPPTSGDDGSDFTIHDAGD
ncbi:type I-E CRISPR-associated protein Cse2/CasB [Streptomyces xinghaiensis]|uniref:type I-E CRISPR-associated protein Cse2/CasB n=1 Tax=Streptomyces xinghaiensis TaxID=1038928 RepID=UPI00378F014A